MNRLLSPSWVMLVTLLSLKLGCSRKEPAPEPVESSAAPEARPTAAQVVVSPKSPVDLGTMNIPPDNPQSDAKVELGHQLFFDKRLSVDGSRACYSCHRNEDGTGGHDPTAIGAKGKKLPRHSPVLWNVGYLPRLYWDGRADSLEKQALGAWGGGNMGVGKDHLQAKAQQIAKIAKYQEQFSQVFGKEGVSPTTIVKAIAAYERTLVCDDTAYDRYDKGDQKALSDQQKRGLALFTGEAACSTCHTPPFFSLAYKASEGAYFNTGVGTQGKPESDVDVGRMDVTQRASDWAAFKVPTLRNVSRSAPYFHDGSVVTLEQAVRFMAGGGAPNRNRSSLLADRKLNEQEIRDLAAFLGALDCPGKLEEPKRQ